MDRFVQTAAEKLRQQILEADSALNQGRMQYYVACDGNDENDGRTPERPIRSLMRICTLPLRSGDRILFRRGDVFRAEVPLGLRGGVHYGAYGTGPKPVILGSRRDYADPALWTKAERDLWQLQLPTEEAGVMVMNQDRLLGFRKLSLPEAAQQADYYHDVAAGILYFCSPEGNPGSVYESIEIGTTDDIFLAQNVNDVRVDNLTLKYASKFAVDLGNNKEIRITNCEIGFIGGAVYRGNIRYGNGIQFWYRAEEVQVEHCWLYQIYDAALTFQGLDAQRAIFRGVSFRENLIEKCSMNIEFWAGKPDGTGPVPELRDILIQGNILLDGGRGWGGYQRPDKGDQALLLAWGRYCADMRNCLVTENVFSDADCNLIWCLPPEEQPGLEVRGNCYYQKAPAGINPFMEVVRGRTAVAADQKSLEAAVAFFDKTPGDVRWLEE